MTQPERINVLKNEVPKLKDEIIKRSRNTVEGSNYVYVTENLKICVADIGTHFRRQRLIHFSTGPLSEKTFQKELQEAIRHEQQYVEVNH